MICCWTDEQHHGIYLIIWRTELCFGKGNMTWYQNNTRHFSIKILHLTFTMCFLFYDRLLCCNEAILVSYQFLGLLLLKSSEPAMGNSLKSVLFDTVSGEVFLLRIWQYFFFLRAVVTILKQTLAMTLILQDDHLTARTWAVRSVSGQDASCARAVVLHFAELTVSFFLWKRISNA